MSPKSPLNDRAMTSAERVRRARWSNRVEEFSFKLLGLLENVPTPIPRSPEIPEELLTHIEPFLVKSLVSPPDSESKTDSSVRVLKLGNGNQANNKKIALKFIVEYFGATQLDGKSVLIEKFGKCHVSAFTHLKGAMVSTPNDKDQGYGGRDWHFRDHMILFRDTGEGSCIIYFCLIEPLFENRTIGHHGVTWDKIDELSLSKQEVSSIEVNNLIENIVP